MTVTPKLHGVSCSENSSAAAAYNYSITKLTSQEVSFLYGQQPSCLVLLQSHLAIEHPYLSFPFLSVPLIIQGFLLHFFGIGNGTLASTDVVAFQFENVGEGLCCIDVLVEFWGSLCRTRTITTTPSTNNLTLLYLNGNQIH